METGCEQRTPVGGTSTPSGAPADARPPLSAEAKERALARYSTTAHLRRLLTHDPALGGTPIRMASARWLLEHFQAAGNEAGRLEHRQALERAHGDAPFVSGEKLERALAEVESGQYQGVTGASGLPIPIAFPSLMAMSHMWLHSAHPDPEAKNLRQLWLPALEWLYSERVRQLTLLTVGGEQGAKGRARADGDGVELSDARVLEAADFGIFIDFASVCQKENDARTYLEHALFKFALGSLDVIYAHKAMATLLSTRLPDGVDVRRGYDDRGWTCFERAESQLIKPDTLCIDIGLFTVERACEEQAAAHEGGGAQQPTTIIGGTRFAERTVAELARQASYRDDDGLRGLLGALAGSGRAAPLAPEAFAKVVQTKRFTNGADASTVIELYAETATALLGSVEQLEYKELEWDAAEYARLGEALRYCGALERLRLDKMGLDDAGAAAVLVGTPLPSMKTLHLDECSALTALPSLEALVSLKTLDLRGCSSLTCLPSLEALASLEELDLRGCSSLTALPNVSGLANLQTFLPPRHLE